MGALLLVFRHLSFACTNTLRMLILAVTLPLTLEWATWQTSPRHPDRRHHPPLTIALAVAAQLHHETSTVAEQASSQAASSDQAPGHLLGLG